MGIVGALINDVELLNGSVESFDRALSIDPSGTGGTVGAVWNNRGSVLLALGREKEAEESYANALRNNVTSDKFSEDLGNLRSVVGCMVSGWVRSTA